MTKAEKLARRMHELANEFFAANPRKDFEGRMPRYENMPPYRIETYMYVARGLLRDQTRKQRAKK